MVTNWSEAMKCATPRCDKKGGNLMGKIGKVFREQLFIFSLVKV